MAGPVSNQTDAKRDALKPVLRLLKRARTMDELDPNLQALLARITPEITAYLKAQKRGE
jgi:hypothetical protein